ncbi:DNA-methyltransferase [Microbacterium enclense]|uniref:DNA-methyltransferase n=1 Tax=Microbacterium enclense TaxID=993073 RepID=UPI003F80AA13
MGSGHQQIIHGEALTSLRGLADNSVDGVITDPPYGLTDLTRSKVERALSAWLAGDRQFVPDGRGMMSRRWDRFVPPPAVWEETMRVLKPGGFLLVFAAARTQDLMGMSMRLAGFDTRDVLTWLRGGTFAKTPYTLRPGYEPVLMTQKPCEGTIASNIETWGTGGLNIDGCRVPFASESDETESKGKNQHGEYGTLGGANRVYGTYARTARSNYDAPGRWPANAVLDDESAAHLDSLSPSSVSRKSAPRQGAAGNGWRTKATGAEYDDAGGPSRFFPRMHYSGRAPAKERPVGPDGTRHDTVKPLSVVRWLVRLAVPPGGVVLDMFAGSGTTAEAALLEGRGFIVVEREGAFIPLIEQRVVRSEPRSA